MRLTDIFAAFASSWPADKINTSWPPTTDGSGLAAQAAKAIEVEDVVSHIGADDTVTITGRLTLVAGVQPAATRLTSHLFPSLGFTFAPEAGWRSDFRASVVPGGDATVQIDTLPLIVFIPPDLLRAHDVPAATDPSSGIQLSENANDTEIKRDFSFLFDAQREIHLEPHLPISIGPCTLFGLPAKAVHELTLIASTPNARAQVDWLVRGFDDTQIPLQGGVLAFGGIELDWDVPRSALNDLRARLRLRHDAHVIIEDLALPSVLLRPVPLHGALGVRRSLDIGESLAENFTFADAPVVIPVGRDVDIFLDKFFFRTPAEDESLSSGLTIEGGVSWPDGDGSDYEAEIGFIDGDVVRVSFAHTPPPTGEKLPVVRLNVWKYVVDIFRLRVGLSIDGMRQHPAGPLDPGAESPDESSPADALQLLVDILIQEKTGGGDGSAANAVEIKTEDGRPFEAALVDVGWDRGKPSGSLAMPRGTQLHLSRFVLEVHEMGLAYENGATYFSVSGAIREKVAPFEGGVWFTRLRGKLVGDPDAPSFQLGGVGLDFRVEKVVEISLHGSYRDQRLPDGTSIKEYGLGGGLVIYAGDNKWGLTIDVYWGSRKPAAGDSSDYFLLLVALFGAIPAGPFEFRGIEALYATGLMPKLDAGDRGSGELKYYKWLKRARPTALPENRGVDAWQPTPDAWAFGLGFDVSITGCGSVFQIKAFGAGFDSPTASGLIVVVEFGMFGSKKPLAIGVFEYDFKTDAFVVMFQFDVRLADLIDNWPEELELKLTGPVTFGNKPGLVAFGRLGDAQTWLVAKLELELSQVLDLKIRLAVCVEWQENEHIGGGLSLSIEVAGSMGVIRLRGWGALEVLTRWMRTGTNDFVARLRVECGFQVIVFGFLRFGISLQIVAEWLAHVPNYLVFRVTFRFETPWFLPDVSYTLECVEGELKPAERSVVTGPLQQAGAISPSGTFDVRVRRIDSGDGGDPTALDSVQGMTGASGAWRGEAQPAPLDATIEVDFSVMLVDLLGIGAVNPDLGEQVSGDGDLTLSTRFSLVGLTVRRRPLASGTWDTVESLVDESSPRNFRWSWDDDTRIGGQVAPKKLLFNGRTPFVIGLDNPLADAEILEDNPSYPCCQIRRPDAARFDFEDDAFETLPNGFVRPFRYEDRGTVAPVRIQGRACVVRPPHTSGATTGRVGAFGPGSGPVATISASDDLAVAVFRVAVDGRRKVRLVVVAFDTAGTEVLRHHDNTGASTFVEVRIDPGLAFRTIVVLIEDLEPGVGDGAPSTVVLDSVECVTQRDKERFDRERKRCSRDDSDGPAEQVNFLPRHEYEIALTTEVAVRHSATEWETTTITERVGFVTSGPPGLNETPEPGLELAPYVVSRPPGGRGLTYREEAVHIALSDGLRLFGPGIGISEADYRLPVTMVIESAFDANRDAHAGKGSRASAEWFLANRGGSDPWLTAGVLGVVNALTRGGAALRYRALTQVSAGTCPPDEVWSEQQPWVVVPPFEPSGPGLWEPSASYMANLRLAGSPVVDRDPFEEADISSFSAVSGTWTFEDGCLVASAPATGAFGEADWDYYRVEIRGRIGGPGGELGVVVLDDPTDPTHGVRALVRRTTQGGSLVVESAAGLPINAVPLDEVGDDSAIVVEAFADSVRCRCGEVALSVPRGVRGPGRCVLLANDARVVSLRVHGLDMFRQPFRTSRYESFSGHVGSCTGLERYDAGTAAEPIATVLARLGSALAAAMSPDAPDVDRDARFNEVASALAAPLREDPRRLHLTCMSSATDRWLLLESPEPMSFSEEIVLGLELKVVRPGLSDADRVRLGALIEAALRDPQPRSPLPGPVLPLPDRRGVRSLVVPRELGGLLDAPGARRPVYSARLEGRLLLVTTLSTGTVARLRAPLLSADDRALLVDVTVDLNASLRIIRWHMPNLISWVAQNVTVIQNGPATHAFVLPSASGLVDGSYRMKLELIRRWIDTVDPTGPDNAYLDDSTIEFELVG